MAATGKKAYKPYIENDTFNPTLIGGGNAQIVDYPEEAAPAVYDVAKEMAASQSSGPSGAYSPQYSEQYSERSSGYTPTSGNYMLNRNDYFNPNGDYGIGDLEYDPFETSGKTDEYFRLMKDAEAAQPDKFVSRYDGAIQSILDGIMNKKSFDLKHDQNYQQLYDNMRESYMQAGNKAMRDSMGAMQAATGGYGSTAAQIAGSQAYDNYLQGMNNNNQALTQLAYQMYRDDQNDKYNQLGAFQSADNTDYGRYSDDYNRWLQNRQYLADQYQRMYGNDWNEYQYNTDMQRQLDLEAAQMLYQTDRDNLNMAYGVDSTNAGRQYDIDNTEYERAYRAERDAKSDYDDAVSKAMQFASQGLSIPSRYKSVLDDDTLGIMQSIAAQAVADKAAKAGGGSGRSGGSGGGKKSSGSKADASGNNDSDDATKRALFYSTKGYSDDAVTDMLIQYGFSDSAIEKAMNNLRG